MISALMGILGGGDLARVPYCPLQHALWSPQPQNNYLKTHSAYFSPFKKEIKLPYLKSWPCKNILFGKSFPIHKSLGASDTVTYLRMISVGSAPVSTLAGSPGSRPQANLRREEGQVATWSGKLSLHSSPRYVGRGQSSVFQRHKDRRVAPLYPALFTSQFRSFWKFGRKIWTRRKAVC